MAGFFGANGYPQHNGFRPLEQVVEEEAEESEIDPVSGLEAYKNYDGEWMTNFPPPPGFDGQEDGCFGDNEYERALSGSEMLVMLAREEAKTAELRTLGEAARNAWFGFAPEPVKAVKVKSGATQSETDSADAAPSWEERLRLAERERGPRIRAL